MQVEAGFLVRAAAQSFGSRVALTAGPRNLTFTELNEVSNRVGSALVDLGVARGDRVGVLAYNTPEVVQTWFGCEKHNLVRVVLHSHFSMEDHVLSLNEVEATALVFDTRFSSDVELHKDELKTVRQFVGIGADCPDWATPFAQLESGGSAEDPYLDVDEDAPCFLQLTSGTTGHPKAWVKTYRSWQAVIDHNLHHFDTFGPGVPPVGPDDVNLHFHPIQWASGFQTLYPYYVRGARSVLLDDEIFHPGVLLDTIASEQVTGVLMPGPLLTPVLDEIEARGGFAHKLRRMVVFFSNPDQLDRTTRLLGPIWAHGFGSTEQGAITTRLLPHEVEERRERIKSVGRSGSPFLEVAVVDEQGTRLGAGQVGEIVVRSAKSLGGYWAWPERNAQSFFPGDWFRPYDVGFLDEDGFLYYVGRRDTMIKSSGYRISPTEVEEVLFQTGKLRQAAVIGVPDEVLGQSIKAFLVAKNGEPLDCEAVRTFCAEKVPRYMVPKHFEVLNELPKTSSGKVDYPALRRREGL